MVRVNGLDILIDGSSRGFFHPGEEIKGRVVFYSQGILKVNKIRIKLKGMAYCAWVEKQGHLMQNYTKRDTLICEEQVILGSKEMKEQSTTISLQSGRHSYAFRFELPRNLPTNFRSRLGYIRYSLKVLVDRPWRAPIKRKLPITIVDPIEPENAKKIVNEAEGPWKTVPLCRTYDNKVTLQATVDKVMYRPGERVVIDARCDNKSSRSMRVVKAKLIKIKEFFSTKTYSESKTVAKVHGPSVAPKRVLAWDTGELVIPRVPASILFCKVLRLRYVLEVQVVVPFGFNLKVCLPIIVDNVPLKGNHALPILHGPHLKRRRIITAVTDRMFRPKRSRNYNRLSLLAESTNHLELGQEEFEDDNAENLPPEEGLGYSDAWPHKGQVPNGIDINAQGCNGSIGKGRVW